MTSRQKVVASRRRTVLVLGGGGALGAFQAGVYQGLEEAGVALDWRAGSSIGAVNAALIAGNPPTRRLERLRAFSDLAAEPGLPDGNWSGDLRRLAKTVAALHARLLGRSGLYRPHLPRLFLQAPGPRDRKPDVRGARMTGLRERSRAAEMMDVRRASGSGGAVRTLRDEDRLFGGRRRRQASGSSAGKGLRHPWERIVAAGGDLGCALQRSSGPWCRRARVRL